MRHAARMRPTPRIRTAPAKISAPMYARFIKPFGCDAVGEATDRKNAVGIKIATFGTPDRASHFQKGESKASSTYTRITSDRTIQTPPSRARRARDRVGADCRYTPAHFS